MAMLILMAYNSTTVPSRFTSQTQQPACCCNHPKCPNLLLAPTDFGSQYLADAATACTRVLFISVSVEGHTIQLRELTIPTISSQPKLKPCDYAHQQIDILDILKSRVYTGRRHQLCLGLLLIIYRQLSLSAHVATLCQLGLVQLQQLHPLTTDAVRKLFQDVISCHLVSPIHCCMASQSHSEDAVSPGCCCWSLTMLSCYTHAVSVVGQHVKYMVTHTHLLLHLLSGQHLYTLLTSTSSSAVVCPLLSASARTCVVSRTYNSVVERSFTAADPCAWCDSLLSYLHQDISYEQLSDSWKLFYLGPRNIMSNCQWCE